MKTPAMRLLLGVVLILVAASPPLQAAILFVSNTQTSGTGSLRGTVAAAAAGDTIVFNIPTSDPGYSTSTGVFTIFLTSGEIVIDKDLSIAGPSAANIALDGVQASRIFNVTAGTVAISNLSLVEGLATGARAIHE